MVTNLKKFCMSAIISVLVLSGGFASAQASILKATVDLSEQRMRVFIDGKRRFTWRVSTGKAGWRTKAGSYTPFSLRKKYYSTKWRMSLPYLVSISQDGTAIHGTYLASKLGRTASHGCIRLSIANAAKFYSLIEQHGMWSTEVLVKP